MAAFEDKADENDEITFNGDSDISQQLMNRYSKSSAAQHRHLVATAAAMRSILTSESLPPSPPAFFAAAISSVDSSTADPTAVSALLTFLSLVVPLVPTGEISATMAREAVTVLVKPIDEEEGDKLGVASLRAGVKCIGTLLVGFCDLDDWESLQVGFDSLLKFSIDKRPKVRRCAQECLEKLFGSLRTSTVKKEASNSIYALLNEYKPALSDLSSTKIEEGSKVESTLKSENAEAAHVLNVLSATIPFLSGKVKSRVFSELCKLMAPRFSPLSRQILKAIDTIFKNSEDTIIVPEIDGVITSLIGYLSFHGENPADTIVHVTTLLKTALEKVYSVKLTIGLSKLPLVCGSLAGILSRPALFSYFLPSCGLEFE